MITYSYIPILCGLFIIARVAIVYVIIHNCIAIVYQQIVHITFGSPTQRVNQTHDFHDNEQWNKELDFPQSIHPGY